MPTKVQTPNPSTPTPGTFNSAVAYSFQELGRRGFGSAALREMQRRGLPARRVGKVKIVLGSDLLDYFAALPVERLDASIR